jgi:hypothetical protein
MGTSTLGLVADITGFRLVFREAAQIYSQMGSAFFGHSVNRVSVHLCTGPGTYVAAVREPLL